MALKEKKILVVDDNRGMLRFMTNLMRKEGHDVETAEDGFAALDKLNEYRPDILFVDLIMPKIAGDKLCRYVRKNEHLKHCYVVVISAAAAEMDLDYRAIGADACIAKGPFATMSRNVLEVIRASESVDAEDRPTAILGLENIYARRITQELLSRKR
ncbi:MAG: response regulator, partial [Desulfobacteraceae bacterium]|nr:response regulator [Desulfobacteraceae bacterium]